MEREPLSRDRVARAALALIDRDGLAGLSMRKLGSELGVEAMSLYKHVAGKDALLQAVVEVALASVGPIDESATPAERIRQLARSLRAMGRAHPEVFSLVVAQLPVSPTGLVPIEATLGALRASGLEDRQCVHLFWVIVAYIAGSVLGELGSISAGSFQFSPTAYDAARFPHFAALATLLGDCHHDDEFEFGLDCVLRDVESAADQAPRRRRRSASRG